MTTSHPIRTLFDNKIDRRIEEVIKVDQTDEQILREEIKEYVVTDASLAIAHGLEDVFWLEGADGKWKTRPRPTRSIEELIHERTSPAVKAALKSLTEAPAARLGGSGRRPRNGAANRANEHI